MSRFNFYLDSKKKIDKEGKLKIYIFFRDDNGVRLKYYSREKVDPSNWIPEILKRNPSKKSKNIQRANSGELNFEHLNSRLEQIESKVFELYYSLKTKMDIVGRDDLRGGLDEFFGVIDPAKKKKRQLFDYWRSFIEDHKHTRAKSTLKLNYKTLPCWSCTRNGQKGKLTSRTLIVISTMTL